MTQPVSVRGAGVVFKVTISDSLTAITQVIDITPPGMTHDTFEVTNLGSDAKQFEKTGIPDSGEVTLTLLYDPANVGHAELLTLFGSEDHNAMAIDLTDVGATVIAFDGLVTGWTPSQVKTDDKLTVDVKIKVNDATTYTVGS